MGAPINTADPSGLTDPQARAALHRHLTAAAEATSAAVGLAAMGRALEVLAAVAHQHLVDAGRTDGFDVENGFDDQHTVPATAGLGGGA